MAYESNTHPAQPGRAERAQLVLLACIVLCIGACVTLAMSIRRLPPDWSVPRPASMSGAFRGGYSLDSGPSRLSEILTRGLHKIGLPFDWVGTSFDSGYVSDLSTIGWPADYFGMYREVFFSVEVGGEPDRAGFEYQHLDNDWSFDRIKASFAVPVRALLVTISHMDSEHSLMHPTHSMTRGMLRVTRFGADGEPVTRHDLVVLSRAFARQASRTLHTPGSTAVARITLHPSDRFEGAQRIADLLQSAATPERNMTEWTGELWSVTGPFRVIAQVWNIATLFAVGVVLLSPWMLERSVRRLRVARRLDRGCCPRCGYGLGCCPLCGLSHACVKHDAPRRCPECGLMI